MYWIGCVYLTLALCLSAAAQSVTGVVTDERRSPIAGAVVSVHERADLIEQTRTDNAGLFTVSRFGQGRSLRITASGFAVRTILFGETNTSDPLTVSLEPSQVSEEVIVSITQTGTRLSETPASVIAIGRETLDATAAQSVDDVLRQVPGFGLFRRSSSRTTNPTAQGANLRGLAGSGTSRASVMLEGVSINDAFGGWTYWTRVPLAAVEQIEVLRGGASSIYGDEALSGAVSMTTAGERNSLRLETSAGTQDTYDVSTFASAGTGSGWSISGSFDGFRTGGYIPVAEEERGLADAEANSRYRNGFLTITKRFGDDAGLFVRGNIFHEDRDNGTRLTENRTYFRQAVFGGDVSLDSFGTFRLRSFIEKQVYDQNFTAVSADRSVENITRIQRVPSQASGINVYWTKQLFRQHMISAAGEFREVRGASDEIGFSNGIST